MADTLTSAQTAMREKGIIVGGMLYTTTTDNVIADAQQLYDFNEKNDQQTINAQLRAGIEDAKANAATKRATATKYGGIKLATNGMSASDEEAFSEAGIAFIKLTTAGGISVTDSSGNKVSLATDSSGLGDGVAYVKIPVDKFDEGKAIALTTAPDRTFGVKIDTRYFRYRSSETIVGTSAQNGYPFVNKDHIGEIQLNPSLATNPLRWNSNSQLTLNIGDGLAVIENGNTADVGKLKVSVGMENDQVHQLLRLDSTGALVCKISTDYFKINDNGYLEIKDTYLDDLKSAINDIKKVLRGAAFIQPHDKLREDATQS